MRVGLSYDLLRVSSCQTILITRTAMSRTPQQQQHQRTAPTAINNNHQPKTTPRAQVRRLLRTLPHDVSPRPNQPQYGPLRLHPPVVFVSFMLCEVVFLFHHVLTNRRGLAVAVVMHILHSLVSVCQPHSRRAMYTARTTPACGILGKTA